MKSNKNSIFISIILGTLLASIFIHLDEATRYGILTVILSNIAYIFPRTLAQ